MKAAPLSLRPLSAESLRAIPYEDTKIEKPPIPISFGSPPPNSPRKKQTGLRRPNTSASQQLSPCATPPRIRDDVRRDSGLAPSTTARDSRTTLATELESPSLRNSPSLPKFTISDDSASTSSKKTRRWGTKKVQSPKPLTEPLPLPQSPFMGLVTEIPTGNFEDLTSPGQIEFSKRGSMLIGGRKANSTNGGPFKHSRTIGSRRVQDVAMLSSSFIVPSRVLSTDDELVSNKVRSMYEAGADGDSDWPTRKFSHRNISGFGDDIFSADDSSRSPSRSNGKAQLSPHDNSGNRAPSRAATVSSTRESVIIRDENELAGGIEDWEDIDGADVDRYGFIIQRRLPSQGSSTTSPQPTSPEPPKLQRVSTSLQVASDAPRRQRSTIKRKTSTARSATTKAGHSARNRRPTSSQSSYQGSINGSHSKIRSATNRLPYNKDRRVMDEAGDMLTLPPGLADIAEHEEDSKVAEELKRKEWEREEKWRKMAKVVSNNRDGGGMTFEFDTRNPKLIERTWKGIPDRWRATAWYAFLSASAKRNPESPSDTELIAAFQRLLDQGSPDDFQIDVDVPRTINSHIMFRRRYRGGQRLLFRVLHCLSIYFPETGYVQGMAALAATLLCYFDEEMTFVMLVRLWQLRGLERLYQSGFEGLMQALDEFETIWLGKGDVAAKLVSFFGGGRGGVLISGPS